MNRRCITILLGLGLGVGTQLFAQSTISPSIKANASISATDQSAIAGFLKTQTGKLMSKELADQMAGRDAMANVLVGEPQPSAAFIDAYALAVNDAMLAVAANPDARIRLNGAIVVSRVAERSGSMRLKPAASKFATDSLDSVVLWGVKAHKPLILTQIRATGKVDAQLLTGLARLVKDHPAGPIVQEAYEALRLDIVQQRKNVSPEMLKIVVPAVQELLSLRIALYKTGIPDVPEVDTLGTSFLVDGDVLKIETPEQRVRSGQLICDLLANVAARTVGLEKDRSQKEGLVRTLQLVGSAVRVIADTSGKPDMAAAALVVSKIDTAMDSAVIIKNCDDLIAQSMIQNPGITKPKIGK